MLNFNMNNEFNCDYEVITRDLKGIFPIYSYIFHFASCCNNILHFTLSLLIYIMVYVLWVYYIFMYICINHTRINLALIHSDSTTKIKIYNTKYLGILQIIREI